MVANMIASLKQQLWSAVERQERWNRLGVEMHGQAYRTWKYVSDLNHAEIEHLSRLLACAAEYELRRNFAHSAKQTAEDGLENII